MNKVMMIACLFAASAAAQTAREVLGAAALLPLQNEPPAKIIVDPPLAQALSIGVVVIQYRTENLHIVPVFGPAALAVSPRVGHVHVTRVRTINCSIRAPSSSPSLSLRPPPRTPRRMKWLRGVLQVSHSRRSS
jgi:hypothetical protein